MILMVAIDCVFANRWKYFEFLFSSFLWLSLIKDGFFWCFNFFFTNLSKTIFLKANEF